MSPRRGEVQVRRFRELLAAVSSLLSFALGAVVVVLPFVFGSGLAVPVAITSAGMALFMVGATLNGRNVMRCGARQLLGVPRWCLARLSNCGYLQCTVASRAVRLDS
jgi:VIT1/CCC1 family predicted Fe2+/Mn2+ transporter